MNDLATVLTSAHTTASTKPLTPP